MSNELAVRQLDNEAVALISTTIAKGCTPDELALFIQQCNRTQLDPFARQIYAVKRWDGKAGREVMQTQVSIDGARLVAQRSGEYAGQTAVFYCGEDRQWTDLWLDSDGFPKAAKVGVYRKGFVEPLWATATWEQYAVTNKLKSGEVKLGTMWAKMPALMLGKCAEMLALRKAFPMELSGLYSAEEMGQADNPPAAEPQSGRKSPAPKTRTRSAPEQDRDIDGEGTRAIEGLIGDITDDGVRGVVRNAWKGSGLPTLAHGLTADECARASRLIHTITDEPDTDDDGNPIVEAEVVAPESGTTGPESRQNPRDGELGASQGTTAARPTTQISTKQVGMIRAKLANEGVHDDVHDAVGMILGGIRVDSLNDLTKAQASKVIDALIDREG